MSTNATREKRPFGQIQNNEPVNPPGEWRFRCVEGHSTLYWSSRKTVNCRGCGTCGNYGDWTSIPVGEIEDQKTGRTLADIIEEHDEA